MLEVVIWQTCVSPHMAGLAAGLARAGAGVTYVAGRSVSPERSAMGWPTTQIQGVRLIVLEGSGVNIDEFISGLSLGVVHIVQGVRRNGYLQHVISSLRARRARWGVLVESVRDVGLRGFLKRLDYRFAFLRRRSAPDFVLAIGKNTPEWIAARGFPHQCIYPFTYFLTPTASNTARLSSRAGRFTVGYVGRVDSNKRVDLLIAAMANIDTPALHFSLIGAGPLSDELKALAISRLGNERVQWRGAVPHREVQALISQFDCLVLPSDFDGWGAVVSEALMNGVPAICSDACGAAEAVIASGVGGVFPRGDVDTLTALLRKLASDGPLDTDSRQTIARWAQSLSGDAGAKYLLEIINAHYYQHTRPVPPWRVPPMSQRSL